MKIAMLAVSTIAFLHLKGPDGQHLYEAGQPVGIDLFGPGSNEAAIIEAGQSARAIKRMQDNDNKIALPSIDIQRAETTADLIAYTAGVRNIDVDAADGTPLTGPALFTAMYSDPALGWIKAQVVKFVADWGNFKPGSATS